MVQVQVRAQPDRLFQQEIHAGRHSFLADAPEALGGHESGPDPHELLLASLGACTTITLQMYARRKNIDLKNVVVNLQEEQVEDPDNPQRKTAKITRVIEVTGNLTPDEVDALQSIADKCPIHKLLSGPKQISTSIVKSGLRDTRVQAIHARRTQP